MYHRVVAARIRTAWRHLEDRDAAFVLDQFAEDFAYHFVGDHALAGTRRTRAAMEAWFARLFRLFPDAHFTVNDVLVRGWPWATRAVALVTVEVSGTDPPYRNDVVQTVDLRWGRITRVQTLEDTQKLAGALQALAAHGLAEAGAPAIVDEPVAAAAAAAPVS